MSELTQERLLELLEYDPATGLFTWRVGRGTARADTIAGRRSVHGYMTIGVDGKEYRAHRLAWLYTTGAWPENDIDHINRVRDDNRWCNLREATRQENQRNNAGRGYQWHRTSRTWQARIVIGGRTKSLGYHHTILDARAAYLRARRQLFGSFA